MFPLVINALLNEGTLVVDEFDASLHPMAPTSILNIFHNDDINTKNAQFFQGIIEQAACLRHILIFSYLYIVMFL